MDKKIEIKEEDPFADNTASENEREFFHEVVTIKTGIADVLLDSDCDVTVKTEIKSEAPFIKQIKAETATWSNNWEIDGKNEVEHQTVFSDIGSQNEGEFLFEHPVMMDKKDDSDHEMYNKIEIKEEAWWLQTESSSVCNNIKDGDLPPVKSSRLCTGAVSADICEDSSLVSVAASWENRRISHWRNDPDFESQESNVITPALEKRVNSEPFFDCGDDDCRRALLGHTSKIPLECNICEKSFTQLASLKSHYLIHEDKNNQCKICGKKFNRLSGLKRHNLIHEGKKPHTCEICKKRFTLLGNLKQHNVIHEGKRPYECNICGKNFARPSDLKSHNVTHEDKKPYECKICEKRFARLSGLKSHNLIHEGKKTL